MKRIVGLVNMVLLGILLLVPKDVSFAVSFGEANSSIIGSRMRLSLEQWW